MARPVRPAPARRAFTLLEVVLALSVAVLLLAGLYVAMNVQIQHSRSGRERVEQSAHARAVLNRIAAEILGNLGPVPPTSSSASNDQSSTNQSSTTTPQGTTTTTQTTTTPSASANATTPAATTGGTTASSGNSSAPVVFNQGVRGGSDWLTLYVGRLPRDYLKRLGDLDLGADAPDLSDLRRVTFWLVPNGVGGGLAR